MRALQDLARFIRVKRDEGAPQEVREYVHEHAADIAEALGFTADALRAGTAGVDDDARLARRLLAEVDRARKEGRDAKASQRTRKAQETADAVGSAARWREDCAEIDLPRILASGLTRREDVLVFACGGFTVAVGMAPMFALRGLKRRDLSAFVDAAGLHVRWKTGGLNLRSRPEPRATSVVVNLAARVAGLAA